MPFPRSRSSKEAEAGLRPGPSEPRRPPLPARPPPLPPHAPASERKPPGLRRTSLSLCFLFPTLRASAPGSGPQGPLSGSFCVSEPQFPHQQSRCGGRADSAATGGALLIGSTVPPSPALARPRPRQVLRMLARHLLPASCPPCSHPGEVLPHGPAPPRQTPEVTCSHKSRHGAVSQGGAPCGLWAVGGVGEASFLSCQVPQGGLIPRCISQRLPLTTLSVVTVPAASSTPAGAGATPI